MGYYVNVTAKSGCEDQINALWQSAFDDDYLVMTEDRIHRALADLQVDPDFKHLRWVKTVEDWEDVFPIHARGLGQVFLAPMEGGEGENPNLVEPLDVLQAKVTWLQSHRMLFSEIRNLQDAVDAIGLEYDFDGYREGREVTEYRPDFARLPVEPNNQVYDRCLVLNRPDLWEAFLAWRDQPTVETWDALKNSVVPSDAIGGNTIWSLCERMESQRTGVPSSLYGVYRDGRIPPMTDVVRAMLSRTDVQGTPKQRQCG